MRQNASRENEPSAFVWIFSSLLGLLGAAAMAAGAVLRRRRPGGYDDVTARDRARPGSDS